MTDVCHSQVHVVRFLNRTWCFARVALPATFVALVAGCAANTLTKKEISRAVDAWQRPQAWDQRPTGEQPPSVLREPSASEGPDTRQRVPRPDRPLTPLGAYVGDALKRSPSVKAAQAKVRARLERIAQVTSLPDPVLRAIVRPEPIQTAAGDAGFTLGLSQKLPLPAKLTHAGKMALADAHAALDRLNGVRLQVIADVEDAYFGLYFLDRSIESTQAHLVSLENVEGVLSAQYRVGKVGQQELLRIQTEIAKLRDDENRLHRQRVSAAVVLNHILDYPSSRDVQTTKPATPPMLDIDLGELVTLAVEHNPELIALTHQTERDQEAVKLARLAYWPDATIGFEWTHVDPRKAFEPPPSPATGQPPTVNRKSEVGDDNWALILQFDLPIWRDRVDAAEREAVHKLQQTMHEKRATANTIASRVFDAWSRLQTHRETTSLLKSTLIPQARQTYEVSLMAYQAGKADFLDVIDNWRWLLGFELTLHREVAGLLGAFSELERVVGVDLENEATNAASKDQRGQP